MASWRALPSSRFIVTTSLDRRTSSISTTIGNCGTVHQGRKNAVNWTRLPVMTSATIMSGCSSLSSRTTWEFLPSGCSAKRRTPLDDDDLREKLIKIGAKVFVMQIRDLQMAEVAISRSYSCHPWKDTATQATRSNIRVTEANVRDAAKG